MFLYDSFIILNSKAFLSTFQDSVLKRSDLEFAKKKAVSSYRCLGDSDKITAYKHFLIKCECALQDADEKPLLVAIIDHLAESEDLDSDKSACEKLTRIFCLNFRHQKGVMGIAAMGRSFIDRPIALAAFLYCMRLRGITSDKILGTYLLQDFFRYHVCSLNEKNNPIEQLYKLLQEFTETRLLAERAITVRCQEGGLSSYALDGSVHHQAASLSVIPFTPTPLRFTPDETNLDVLHTLFGVDFLMGVLYQWDDLKNNERCKYKITQLFNQPYVINSQLHEIIDRLHIYTHLQPALASLLTEETLEILIARHEGGILNLIPFCPHLINKIQRLDLPSYLKTLDHHASSGLALISSLFALFDGVKIVDDTAAKLVFDALLNAIIADPYVIDDMSVIRQLRKYSHLKEFVITKAQALETQLAQFIELHTQSAIEHMDYISIEDVWRATAIKIQLLQKISSFKSNCPTDKYKLYSRIARAFVARDNGCFNLSAFTHAVGVEPLFHADHITSYERLIVELLVAIDDDVLRTECIQILDMYVTDRWKTFSYGDHGLLTQATLAGNLGLIQWMNGEKIEKLDGYDDLTLMAAKENHWPLVCYFYAEHKLKKNTVNQLFLLAAMQGALSEITASFSRDHSVPTLKAIEQAFKLVVNNNDIQSVSCFSVFGKKPCDAVVASAFKNAMDLNYFAMTKVIADGFSSSLLDTTINQTVSSAARLNRTDVLNTLVTFSTYQPSQEVIENGLMAATEANQLATVQWFVRVDNNSPRAHVIENARRVAHKLNLTVIENLLSGLCSGNGSNPLLRVGFFTRLNSAGIVFSAKDGIHP